MVISLILQIIELALCIIAGWAVVKSGVLKSTDSKPMSFLTLYVIMPCMLFYAFQIEFTNQVRNGLLLSVVLAVIVHICLIIGTFLLRKFCKLDALEQLSVMYSNAGNLIVPIVTSLYGPEYVIYSSGFLMVQIVLLWSHARTIISGERQIQVKKMILNPNMIAIILGLLVLLFRIPVPQVVLNATHSMGAMVGPLCMIIAGMLIADLKLQDFKRFRRLPLVLFFRLILVPVCVLLLIRGLKMLISIQGFDAVFLIVFLATITPTASTVTQFCQIYDKNSEYANMINLAGTLLCIITMPLMVWLYLL